MLNVKSPTVPAHVPVCRITLGIHMKVVGPSVSLTPIARLIKVVYDRNVVILVLALAVKIVSVPQLITHLCALVILVLPEIHIISVHQYRLIVSLDDYKYLPNLITFALTLMLIFPQPTLIYQENPVTHLPADPIVDVNRTMDKQYVLVYQITSVAHQDVDPSALPPPSVPPRWHALIKNVKTHAQLLVDSALSVSSSIIVQFVHVYQDIAVIHSLDVLPYQHVSIMSFIITWQSKDIMIVCEP